MNAERGPSSYSDTPFSKGHAAELAAMLAAEQAHVPDMGEKRLPGYETAPRDLPPIESDPRYQAIMERYQPIRDEASVLERAYAGYIADREAGRDGNLDHVQLDWIRARVPQLKATVAEGLRQEATPILRERLGALRAMPMYWGRLGDAEKNLDLEPAVPPRERVEYGVCEVETDRIVFSPSHNNWAGWGYSKAEGQSPDLIIDHALKMISGTYDESAASTQPEVRAAVDRDGNYVYLATDGTHRIGAAKLLGRPSVTARVESYNYAADDPWGKAVDAQQRSRQKSA